MKHFFIFCLLFFPLLVQAQHELPYNKGFELVQPQDKLWGFINNMKLCEIRFTNKHRRSGSYAVEMYSTTEQRSADIDAPFFFIEIPKAITTEKKQIKVEGWIKTAQNTSRAAIWIMQYDGKSLNSSKYTVVDADSIQSSKSWQRVSVTVPVVEQTESVFLGGLLNAAGKAWFDDFAIYLDGVLVKDVAKRTAEPTAEDVAWINRNAIQLHGVTSGTTTNDLDSLGKWIGEAKVVGVGEPTHGTSEAAQFKLRLFQYLVERKGFTTFMLEDELPECGRINQYILNGNGSAQNLLNLLFRINRHQELLDLIEWMRTYNQTHEKKVYFRGNDMQSIRVAVPEYVRLSSYFDTTLISYSRELEVLTKPFMTALTASQRPTVSASVTELLTRITQHIEGNKKEYYQKAPADTVHWLLQNVTVLNQYLFSPDFSDWSVSFYYRDSSMAKNTVDYLQLYPNEKVMLWAHNSHIWKQDKNMGGWLDRLLGRYYYPIGIATATGTYTAPADESYTASFKAFPLFQPFAGSLEYYLQKAKYKDLILSLNHAYTENSSRWLTQPLYFRNIGGLYEKEDAQFLHGYKPVLPNLLNALVFIRNTTATKSFMR
ncbi:erythromycin esterase family protein [Telluribacter sp. SYSU D00476]|uniref:erythromycin esterase family protein n=1 Tax=Telluribacter sp. SYSU D00476 TaxID=2811430 RepID=UPI001FF283EE|nr:erythromycin esterase family protein [Telluribacter sp. SYSU D00476]